MIDLFPIGTLVGAGFIAWASVRRWSETLNARWSDLPYRTSPMDTHSNTRSIAAIILSACFASALTGLALWFLTQEF